jgi:tRNA threonylcarbamoyl adenosine modification protein YeaZ
MILIINCTKGFEFALIQNEKTITKKKSKQLKNISEKLVVEIEKALSKLKLNYKSIKKIIVITGPGSFTGIRSAITFAKTLNLYLKIKVIGISRFEVLNLLTNNDRKSGIKNIFVKNNENTFFLQKFNSSGKTESAPELVDLKKKKIMINKGTRIISDGLKIKEYLNHKKKTKKVNLVEIIGYRIEDIYKVAQKLSEKKYIPKPLYTKNFF